PGESSIITAPIRLCFVPGRPTPRRPLSPPPEETPLAFIRSAAPRPGSDFHAAQARFPTTSFRPSTWRFRLAWRPYGTCFGPLPANPSAASGITRTIFGVPVRVWGANHAPLSIHEKPVLIRAGG